MRCIADLHEPNKRIKCKWTSHPKPHVHDLLLKLEGFNCASAIDLNMGHCHVLLDEEAHKMCTMIMPWGKQKCPRCPQGLANAPDIFQEEMNNLFHELEFVCCCVDDLLVIDKGNF